MKSANWIWYYGDFEIYHSLLLHARRRDYEAEYPPFWTLATPYPRVNFKKDFTCPKQTSIEVISTAMGSIMLDNRRYPMGRNIEVGPGNHTVIVQTVATEGFPAIFCDSSFLKTGTGWLANNGADEYRPVGYSPKFYRADQNPQVFPFEYEPVMPEAVNNVEGGYVYDYGKELFGPITVTAKDDAPIQLRCGESPEEALDPTEAVIRYTLKGKRSYTIPSCAFRYIFVDREVRVSVKYEYIPLEDAGHFTCDKERINKIWNTCAYTFHLNSREFYLDGIKRDRWVWGGDAYQSFMVDAYLYNNPEITKRTILALLGKPPYQQHVNTIVDYTMYVIIGAYEYYFRSGDREFTERIKERLTALAEFLFSRLDENGLVCQRPGDWIFIDWSDIDKDGPVCAEQILLWQTYKCLEAMYGGDYSHRAEALRTKIMEDFWKPELGAFIDCAASGKMHVSRHANIFAILYDFVDEQTSEIITAKVLENPGITPITTPYFEFFELMAMCKMGRVEYVLNLLDSYWGGMIDLGATTIWEEFDPKMQGAEHYAMYGSAYSKSLCHAWGAGPIFLLGRYVLGVYPTSPGYKTFEVKPVKGFCKYFEHFQGRVPLPGGGFIEVSYENGNISAKRVERDGTEQALEQLTW